MLLQFLTVFEGPCQPLHHVFLLFAQGIWLSRIDCRKPPVQKLILFSVNPDLICFVVNLIKETTSIHSKLRIFAGKLSFNFKLNH